MAAQKLPKTGKSIPKALFPTAGGIPLAKQAAKAKPAAKKPKKETQKQKEVSVIATAGGSLLGQSLSASSFSNAPSIPISIGNISVTVPLFDSTIGSAGTGQTDLASQAKAAVQKLSISNESSHSPIEGRSEGKTEAAKSPPVLPDSLPPDMLIKIKQLEEVCMYTLLVCTCAST